MLAVIVITVCVKLTNKFEIRLRSDLPVNADKEHLYNLNEFGPVDDYKKNIRNLSELWSEAENAINEKELYNEEFDLQEIVSALQNSAIVNVTQFYARTAFKWVVTLEGGQKALFKPRFYKDVNRRGHCEFPEHEVTAFILTRMFDMRNMPYVTGRVVNWYRDILPVATEEVKEYITEYTNGTEKGVTLSCRCKAMGGYGNHTFNYPNGNIPGVFIYWVDRRITELNLQKIMFKIGPEQNESSPEYKEGLRKHCTRLEEKPKPLAWFDYIINSAILDFLIMRRDIKLAYILDEAGHKVSNVMIDRGNGFYLQDESPIIIIAPLYQCCRIGERTYSRLNHFKDTFKDTFLEMSKDDPLFPLLKDEQLNTMELRFTTVLNVVNACIQERGKDAVVMKS